MLLKARLLPALALQPHDIIISVNGDTVGTSADMAKIAAGDPGFWRVEIERDGQRIRQVFR